MSMPTAYPPLALYVHLPWCVHKCPYCDFNSHERKGELPQQSYVDALLEDLDLELGLLSARANLELSSVFIGGGTPSLFDPDQIARLLAGIRQRISIASPAEITMEANPGTMEAARYQGFRQAGITRLSLGVQSFDDDCLRRLGRIHDGAAARRAAEHAAAAGFDSFNIDLMFGLPGQDIAGAMQDVRLATELSGGHISHYQLTLEPNTVFYRRPPPLPADDDIALMQDRCAEVLAGAGYTRYEVSAWARSGLACRHNMNYWQFGDYLGIGAGGHGKLTVDGRILRRRRHRVPESWLQARPVQRVVASREVPQADLPLEFAMNSLRLPHGVPLRLFTERTGLPVSALLDPLASAIDGGQLTIDNDTLHATPAGLEHLNEILLPLVPEPADA